MEDLNTIIEDSLTDATLPTPEVSLDAPTEALEASPEPTETISTEVEPTPEVASPTAKLDDTKPIDDFDKKFGLSALSSSGRENRIPYSRVKKITDKAVKDALDAKTKEYEAQFVPKIKADEYEAKVKDYEGRLTQVANFERVMVSQPVEFLKMLYDKQPGYAALLDKLAGSAVQPQQPQAAPEVPVPTEDPMPMPDQQLPDGSAVYSLEGLNARDAWNRRQAQKETIAAIEKRYAPLETSFKSYQKVQEVIPHVKAQIKDARTWPLFNENEAEIVKVLQAYPTASLERAYQHVVVPKMRAEQERITNDSKVSRESIRAEILKELKTAPRATSAGVGQSRPAPTQTSGPRSMEDIIADSIKGLSNR